MGDDKLTPQVGEETETLPILQSAKDLFEQIDTGELVADLEKRVTGAWAYQFPMDGKPVKGLSAAGARESAVAIAHQSGGQLVIRVLGFEPPGVVEEPDCFKASIKAGVYVVGVVQGKVLELLTATSIGYAKQPKYGKRAKDGPTWKKGDRYSIVHAEVHSVSKAERNAIAHLIPDRIKNKILEIALRTGRVESEEVSQPANEKPPSSNGKNGITTKQLNLIQRLLKNSKITDQQQADFKKAFNKGMTSKQASQWIEFLNDFIGEE